MKKIALLVLALVPLTVAADKNYQSGKGTTWDCTKDPVVNINHGKGNYKFKGACDTINLNGGKSTLTIEEVDTLNVSGGQNKITIDTVDTINIAGASNTITYKKTKDGDDTASVNVVGTGNKVEKVK